MSNISIGFIEGERKVIIEALEVDEKQATELRAQLGKLETEIGYKRGAVMGFNRLIQAFPAPPVVLPDPPVADM
jgi:hypothetical protein